MSAEGIDNVLVYAKGSIESPIVSKIVKINLDNETEIEIFKRWIYERQGIIEEDFLNGIFDVYDVRAFPYGGLQRGKGGQGSEVDRRSEVGRRAAEKNRTDEGEPSVSKVRFSISSDSNGRD